MFARCACDVLCDGVWCVIVCFGVSVWVFRLFCLCLVSADVCLMVCDLSLFVMYCVVLSGSFGLCVPVLCGCLLFVMCCVMVYGLSLLLCVLFVFACVVCVCVFCV